MGILYFLLLILFVYGIARLATWMEHRRDPHWYDDFDGY